VKIENGVIAEESRAPRRHFSAAQPYIEHYEDRFNANNSGLFVKEYEEAAVADGRNFGKEFNRVLSRAKEWILFCRDEEEGKSSGTGKDVIRDILDKYILNPGTMHLGGGAALFSKNALSLREFGYDRIAHTQSFDEIGSFIADAVQSSGGSLVFAIDNDASKEGTDFYGARTYAPEYLAGHEKDYDYLLIGHYSRFEEIREEALRLGVEEGRIRMPYEV